ncbi:d7748b40-c13f-44f6-93bd-08083358ee18-CDS [Sclerotinia trifoliorum]|uniref:D7748b40-c13f-44f6-93bd-08083358ee18-CDS n=1 Tax=Sclerotinia trifoliorum TaxID=28548 RepID=A0A8H2VPX6_9HELO|nr:d7748b40-c13f-44f6-93bd-08083358ee18-CDS [Sclerotinia trifoliorum]
MYHATNESATKEFVYQERVDSNISASVNFLTAVKIAVIHQDLWDSLGNLLSPPDKHPDGQIRIGRTTTCRTWVLEAVTLLDDLGYIKLKNEKLKDLENECRGVAESDWREKNRTVEKSFFSIA